MDDIEKKRVIQIDIKLLIVINKLKQYRKEALNDLSKEDLVNIIIELYGVIQDLEDKVSINSKNSSKPPSSDGYNKPSPKSRRVKTGKTIGGQQGHIGTTLERVDNPDLIELHKVIIPIKIIKAVY